MDKSDKLWKKIGVLIIAIILLLFYWIDPLGLFHREPEKAIVEKKQEVVEEFQRMSEEELQAALENVQVGDLISFGVLENQEYLQWKVLEKGEGKILVILDSLLTARSFNDRVADEENRYITVTWENSDVRAWLNDEIYQSLFSDLEKERILDTEVVTPPGTSVDFVSGEVRDGGADTVDKLFLLSYDEVREYMPYADSRIPSNVVYTISEIENGMSYITEIIRVEPGKDYKVKAGVSHLPVTNWWLRTPGDLNIHIQAFDTGFEIDEDGFGVLSVLGVRPAMWVSY